MAPRTLIRSPFIRQIRAPLPLPRTGYTYDPDAPLDPGFSRGEVPEPPEGEHIDTPQCVKVLSVTMSVFGLVGAVGAGAAVGQYALSKPHPILGALGGLAVWVAQFPLIAAPCIRDNRAWLEQQEADKAAAEAAWQERYGETP
jgi:hypothetical protein